MVTPVSRLGAALRPRDVECALAGVSYPARRDDLVAWARNNHAATMILDALATLPNTPFVGPNQVCMALFGRHAQVECGP
jgi:hypothetical protein